MQTLLECLSSFYLSEWEWMFRTWFRSWVEDGRFFLFRGEERDYASFRAVILITRGLVKLNARLCQKCNTFIFYGWVMAWFEAKLFNWLHFRLHGIVATGWLILLWLRIVCFFLLQGFNRVLRIKKLIKISFVLLFILPLNLVVILEDRSLILLFAWKISYSW